MQTDGWAYRRADMLKLMVAFRSFANALKKCRTYSVIMFFICSVSLYDEPVWIFSALSDLKLSQRYYWRFKLCGI